MNAITKAIYDNLVADSAFEMGSMFRSSELHEFPAAVEDYVMKCLIPEIDFNAIAESFAERPWQ